MNTEKPGWVFTLQNGWRVGGIETWTLNIAAQLKLIGKKVIVQNHTSSKIISSPGPDYKRSSFPMHYNQEIFSYAVSRKHVVEYAKQLPSIFVPHCSKVYPLLAHLSRTKYLTLRNIAVVHNPLDIAIDAAVYYESMFSKIIAVSHEISEKLKGKLPLERHRDVLTRPCSIEIPFEFSADQFERKSGPIRLLYAGRIETKQKRIFDLIDIALRLREKGVPFVLTIAGEGPELPNLKLKVQALKLGGEVQIIGPVPKSMMSELFQQHDLHLLPTNYEGTSVAMMEAAANYCPTITYDVGGVGPYVEHNVSGYVFPIGAVDSVAEAVGFLCVNNDKMQGMRRAARKSVEGNSNQIYADWLVSLEQDIWHSEPRPFPAGLSIYYERIPWWMRIAALIPGVVRLKRLVFGNRSLSRSLGLNSQMPA